MKKIISLILSVMFLTQILLTVHAEKNIDIQKVIEDTARFLYQNISDPQSGSIGGEWTIIGLARSGYQIPDEYYNKYYKNIKNTLKNCNGILHDRKYTEYSRAILAITAIGKNPENIDGYNLLLPLGDYEATVWQGINGAVWALIALDSGDYEIPVNLHAKTQSTREMYIEKIISMQNPDGGFSLNANSSSDSDLTAMAIQALSNYLDNQKVCESVNNALAFLSRNQNNDGGFSVNNEDNLETCIQVLTAISAMNISYNDSRFVKKGNTILDCIMTYYNQGMGFCHTQNDRTTNLMSTEQALYGLVAVNRAENGKPHLYHMSDRLNIENLTENTDTTQTSTSVNIDITFTDTVNHISNEAIHSLAKKGIINGKSENIYDPDSTMTRAEFAAITVRALSLTLQNNNIFADVTDDDWHYAYVSTAYENGIIKGISEKEFNPTGTITRQEAAVIIARSAKLCGINTNINTQYTRDVLSQFIDYINSDPWAWEGLAFCYLKNILPNDDIEILPHNAVTRAEVAQMIYNLLKVSNMI